MNLCLSMIVKNESARIERALASAAPWITSWVIVDTGSTDDTKQKIVDFFRAKGIPGEIHDAPFYDWSQARNAALGYARKLAIIYLPDMFLLMDADMELVVKDSIAFTAHRAGFSYDMFQIGGSVHYLNRRLVHVGAPGAYVGVTHEYLDIATAGTIGEEVAYFIDHADGSNRPEKFKRDIRLLVDDMKKDPNNVRSMFYLANSYRDAGKHDRAATWYKRRVDAGGWDEEVWQAQVYYAHALNAQGDEAGFIRELLVAYNMRPQRAEPMYNLANHYRMKGMNAPALACAEAVEHLPFPKDDTLFINDFVYKAGIKEEIMIASFYVPGKREKGYRVCSECSLLAGPYPNTRELGRSNIFHYLEPLAKFCPSFNWQPIDFVPPVGWTAMNPSVTRHHGGLYCNVRCVNYRIDERGCYLIRGLDGTANAENPIRTRNVLISLTSELETAFSRELLPPGNLPCEWPLVLGFEDVRLFSYHKELWTSSTMRQCHPDGNCEQVLARIDGANLVDVKRMLREPRVTEKNWSPIATPDNLEFMRWPGEIVDTDGRPVVTLDTGMATGHVSGSSQLIPWKGGWLAIVHEARPLPGEGYKRFYYHRFAFYDFDGRLKKLSLPFVFHDRVIEFCAGICIHPNQQDFVISYGYKDEEARLATVSTDDVEKFIWLE